MSNLCAQISRDDFAKIIAESKSFAEVSKKLGYCSKGHNYKTIRYYIDKYGLSISHFTDIGSIHIHRSVEDIFVKDSTVDQTVLRRYYLKGEYTDYICAICGQPPIWNNQPLTLTLDHINGKNHDNRLENLRWVCPNCDRQLPTFGSKNPNKLPSYMIKEKKYCIDCGKKLEGHNNTRCRDCYLIYCQSLNRPSKIELEEKLKEYNGQFSKVASEFNVVSQTIRRWCKNYNMPTTKKFYMSSKSLGSSSSSISKNLRVQYSVAQIDPNTNCILNIFPSICSTQAAGFNDRNIADVCKHRIRKTHKGYKWAFVSELEETNPDLLKKYYKKDQISLDKQENS